MGIHPFMRHLGETFHGAQLPVVDMWEMDNKSHTYGYWSLPPYQWSPLFPLRVGSRREGGQPEKQLTLPILENGNYPGNPDTDAFWDYLLECINNPDLLTWEEYTKRFSVKGE